jgi:hypothetical protein
VNLLCKFFARNCLYMRVTRAQEQAGQGQSGPRHDPSDTMFCFTLGGAT